MKIGLVDYGMGNQRSVRNALEALGAEVIALRTESDAASVGAMVLPGVGAFGAGMARIRERGLDGILHKWVIEKGVPFLGICLGMQMIASVGLELGEHQGLSWIDGTVRHLAQREGLRIPHIGWNDVDGRGALYKGIPPRSAFYFVHSYCVEPLDPSVISGSTEHGETFCSSIEYKNVFGVQFHPEKSHRHGLALLRNFLSLAHA